MKQDRNEILSAISTKQIVDYLYQSVGDGYTAERIMKKVLEWRNGKYEICIDWMWSYIS